MTTKKKLMILENGSSVEKEQKGNNVNSKT